MFPRKLTTIQLTSHIEDSPYAFYVMSAVSATAALIAATLGFRKLAKIRKVGLSNSGSSRAQRSRPWVTLSLRRRPPEGWS